MKVKLLLKSKNETKKLVVTPEKMLTIGRSRPSSCIISDSMVSRTHCKVYIEKGQLFIADLDSRNGVILNGIRVVKQRLKANDVVGIGKQILIVDQSATGQEVLEKIGISDNSNRSITIELDHEKASKYLKEDSKTVQSAATRLKRTNAESDQKTKASYKRIIILLILIALIYFGIQGDSVSPAK